MEMTQPVQQPLQQSTPPTLSTTDVEHLRLLRIFYFIAAGIAIAMILFLFLHYSIMSHVLSTVPPTADDSFPATEFFGMFRWLYLIFGILLLVCAALDIIAGIFIGKRQHWTFTFAIAVLNCFNAPIGTALGVFTIMVLIRPQVKLLYGIEP